MDLSTSGILEQFTYGLGDEYLWVVLTVASKLAQIQRDPEILHSQLEDCGVIWSTNEKCRGSTELTGMQCLWD